MGIACLGLIILLTLLTIIYSDNYGDDYPNQAINTGHGQEFWTVPDHKAVIEHITADKMILNEKVNTSNELILYADDELKIPIDSVKEGTYLLFLEYKALDAKAMDCYLTLNTGVKEYKASIPVIWKDKEGAYPLDQYGNELPKEQISIDNYAINAIENAGSISKSDLKILLDPSMTEIILKTDAQSLAIKSVYIAEQEETVNYSEYLAAVNSDGKSSSKKLIVLEGESYSLKSDSFIRGKGVKDPALSPYESGRKKINVLDGDSWSEIGQKVLWEFDIEADGWYQIGFRYSQYSDANKPSYRRIEIDGRVPFQDFEAVSFMPTKIGKYSNKVIASDDDNLHVYLTKGHHTLAMKAVIGPLESIYNDILSVMSEVSDIGMDLKKLTAGASDKNRTWDMKAYLPDVPVRLQECASKIDSIYNQMMEIDGVEPVYANNLVFASDTIRKLLEDTRTLPNKIDLLCEGDGSVSSSLGAVLSKLTKQPLSVDRIYLFNNVQLPKDDVSFFTSLAENIKSFARTFIPGKNESYYAPSFDKESNELQVWVNMSIQYTETLQQIVDTYYNSKYGTNIKLSIMPNEQKLILSNATGTNPDVVLGLSYYTPYELAIRGAAKNLLEYDDFLEFYNEQYNIEGLLPLTYDNGVYGAVDSINFQVLFYRKDILDELGLKVPETWDDVIKMMPELLRHSMNFNTSIANKVGFKTFNDTGPFIYQNKGSFYASDGLSTAFKEDETLNGIYQMTQLYEMYGLQQYIANFFNSFRYGEIPIGIGNFSTYIQLQEAAPELIGLWDIAPVPGERQEDGSILRYQPADSTACMIFANTDKEEEAWRFLKWWLSDKTQVQFAYALERTYSSQYRWNTANLSAFRELPYPGEHKKVILEQLSYQKETVRHPAGYMVERETSNIWNNVVANGKEIMEAAERASIASDREIKRKLQEFGYIDESGNVIKAYPIDTIDYLRQLLQKD